MNETCYHRLLASELITYGNLCFMGRNCLNKVFDVTFSMLGMSNKINRLI